MLQHHNLKSSEIETIQYTYLHLAWIFLFRTTIPQNEEEAMAYDKANSASVKIYTNGSSIEGGIGSAATLYIKNTLQQSPQFYLGSDEHHMVYEARQVGLTLGVALLQ